MAKIKNIQNLIASYEKKNDFLIDPWMIVWNDAHSLDEWTSRSALMGSLSPIVSIGILISDTKESVVLALNYDLDNDLTSCVMTIPQGMIISKKKLT